MLDIGKENFYIELIKEAPCENTEQLKAIEGEYIRQFGTLNSRIEGRTEIGFFEYLYVMKFDYSDVFVKKKIFR